MSNTEKKDTEETSLAGKILKVAAIPLGAITGYWAASSSIRDSVYDRLKGHGAFDSVKPNNPHHKPNDLAFVSEANRQSSEKIAKAVRDVHEAIPVEAGFVNEISRLDKLSAKQVAEQMSHYDGLNSIFKQWKFSHKSTKQRALLDGFTAAGITVGAILAISSSKTLSALTSRKKDAAGDQTPSV